MYDSVTMLYGRNQRSSVNYTLIKLKKKTLKKKSNLREPNKLPSYKEADEELKRSD